MDGFVDKPLSIPRLSSNVPHVPSSTSPRSPRSGVTLLELLVVLIIMALAAAVVLPILVPPTRASITGGDAALANARQTAIRRGEGLRFRLDTDGAWALVPLGGGAPVESGRVPIGVAAERVDVIISPLGSCLPGTARDGMTFDLLRCTWRPLGSS